MPWVERSLVYEGAVERVLSWGRLGAHAILTLALTSRPADRSRNILQRPSALVLARLLSGLSAKALTLPETPSLGLKAAEL